MPFARSRQRLSRWNPFASPTASDRPAALRAGWLVLFAALIPQTLQATDLQVSPIRIALDAQTTNAVMTLVNRGTSDTLLQLSVQAWSQNANGDALVPTRDVLANPGVFLLKAGEQQVARFALRVPPDIKERSYRIVVQEVPRQRVENGLATVLRLLVPLFVAPPNPGAGIEWSARPDPAGLALIVHNKGNVHVQLRTIRLGADKLPPFGKTVNVYILAGATGVVRLSLPKPAAVGTELQLAADSDQGGFSTSVRVGASEGAPERP
jgi:fimbrial chaperone protein